jgi:lipopolysaccharide export system permease protein
MHLLNRHVGNVVLSSILLMLVIIVGLDVIASLVGEMEKLGGRYDFVEALLYSMATIPGQFVNYLPFATLVGCLAGLGSLAGGSELIAIRAAGVSMSKLIWMVFRPAIVLIVFSCVVAEFLSPHTDQYAESRKALMKYGDSANIATRGIWNREGTDFMHFNAVQPNGVLYGVSLFGFDEEYHLRRSLFARRATYQGDYWLMEKVVETRLYQDRTERLEHNTYKWTPNLSPDLLQVITMKPEQLSISGLWSYAKYLEEQDQESGDYLLAFWTKVLQPVATLGLVLVAISFIFGPLRESTMGFRVFTGVLVGIVFRTSQDLLGPASLVYDFAPLVAVLIPISLCIAVGLVLIRRVI